MSKMLSFRAIVISILLVSGQAAANNSVPVTDLVNDIGSTSNAIANPIQAPTIESALAPNAVNLAGANAQMFDIVETLKSELQNLRGQVEELTYTIGRLKQDQKQRYLDLDRRIVNLSSKSSAAQSSATAVNASTQVTVSQDLATVKPVEVTEPDKPTYDPQQEKEDYRAAFNLIKERQYSASIDALLAFVDKYPQGDLLGNAHYWLGEVYMVEGNAPMAALSFELVIKEFPSHRKVPDAIYKAGVAYQQLGQDVQANERLKRVLKEFPNSSAARLAQERVN